MPVRVCKREELMPRRKQTVAASLPELLAAKTKLAQGLNPSEAIEIVLPQSKERGKKHMRQNIKNRLREYLRNLNMLSIYEVKAFARDGQDVIQVAHVPPV